MTRNPPFLYPYTVKHSSRARYVHLRVSEEGLIVVVPTCFCVSHDLLPLLEAKKDWIAETLAKVRNAVSGQGKEVPSVVELRALGERWSVTSAPLTRERLFAENGTIILTSDFNENEALIALRRWLRQKAQTHLPPLLADAAKRRRFAYLGLTIREQKSRWASCSAKGSISLNSRLLFLPPRLVEHVLLHELCHLREMNHSKAFYDILASLDPDAEKNAAELKHAWKLVPCWARACF
ncbi:MAG: M48 family metallopeptidase [Synergistaceae bacterium]|jgi:predicted metal-dependent hydrolase|nr:M48 family metallopeptidase [Synergistaceae bacterium]